MAKQMSLPMPHTSQGTTQKPGQDTNSRSIRSTLHANCHIYPPFL